MYKRQDTTIVESGCELFVPNAFTPNGDGKNDVATVYGIEISELNFQLYDRWGRLVHTSFDDSHVWNGTIKGQPAPQGVYFWQATYKNGPSATQTRQGHISLIR